MIVQTDRAQPHLGTLVSIRVGGMPAADANPLINGAFDRVAAIQRLMSFHDRDSDLSRLNRDASAAPVRVDPRTYEVIARSLDFSAKSSGIFDVTIGGQLARWGYLPREHLDGLPSHEACWRDIELLDDNRIRFHRPMWIDLGGIAKGYAVDTAVDYLLAAGAPQVLVNAGGDLRVAGAISERIFLRTSAEAAGGMVPAVDLTDAAMASSSGREHVRIVDGREVGPHLDGKTRASTGLKAFVSVVADRCISADALTKIVLAKGQRSNSILKLYDAVAYFHGEEGGWRTMGMST
ncbi:MAG: FAD:protein FMN transferase [Alphaproteobacteria bacterium]|nr:FAD:protein FMN transferase [Alphaproteobacteria bacterium]